MYRRIILFSFLAASASSLQAQVPEDALRYSFFSQNGTARNLAIGGAMGSLGGDISATFVNPAGLGNYRTGEFVFSGGWNLQRNRTDFRETQTIGNRGAFGMGPIGLVFGTAERYRPNRSKAFSLAFTQQANFNNQYNYRGYNNFSSFAETFSEEISNSGQSIDQVLNNSQFAFTSAPALYTYLVDTFRIDGTLAVKALPEFVLESGGALLQEKQVRTRGGLYELALGYAVNNSDKFQFGGSIGIPILSYRNVTEFRETDTSSNINNGFGYFAYTDDFRTTGAGLNARIGVIYRPQEHIRFGAAIHTPTYMFAMKDRRTTNLETDTEDYNGQASVGSNFFTNGQAGESNYTMLTPWRFLVSGSYVFREVEDVRKQKAFLTADIEYVHHRGSSFYSANEEPTTDERAYFKSLNQVIRNEYRGNFNFRVGGELKFNVWMTRLGFAYQTNPYRDNALKASRALVSGGVGYRNKGFFADLTYVHQMNRDVNFPYRLQDKANTFADQRFRVGQVMATLGVKF